MIEIGVVTQAVAVIVAGALIAWSIVKLWISGMVKRVEEAEKRIDEFQKSIIELNAHKGIVSEGLKEITRQLTAMHSRLDTFTREIGVLIGEMHSWRKPNDK